MNTSSLALVAAAELAMKSHASKKKQFLVKEQALYDDTFVGEFHGFLKQKDTEQQHLHSRQRMEGARTQAMADASKIHRIQTGQLHKLKSDNQNLQRAVANRGRQQSFTGAAKTS